MTDTTEAATPDAEDQIQEVEDTALPTLADIQKQRDDKLKQLESGEPEEKPTPSEDEVDDDEEESDEEVEEQEEEEVEETSDVLSQFEEMSDKDKEKALEVLREATGRAFGSQRKEIRELKQKLEAAEAAQKEVAAVANTSDSPFGNLHTEEQVTQTIEQVEQNIQQYEDQLDYSSTTQYDEANGKDVHGIEINGQFVSAPDVRKWARSQRENITKLNDRAIEIKKTAKLFDDEDVVIETLKQTMDMDEGESKAFESFISDAAFSVIKTVKPEYAKGLFDVFAKAAIADRKPKKRKTPKAKNESGSIPRGSNTNSKSIVSQIEKLQKIVDGKTGAPIRDRQEADRQLRRLKRK